MPDKPTFVVNDRRKFTSEGEPRHDTTTTSPPTTSAPSQAETTHDAVKPAASGPQLVSSPVEVAEVTDSHRDANPYAATAEPSDHHPGELPEADLLPGDAGAEPSPEEAAAAARAYEATADRLETALRAANPGAERTPPMSFTRLVESLYTQALLLLGGGTPPGETPRVDILGARQTIDMVTVLAAKTDGNRTEAESRLLASALFDLRMGFLEITEALARQAAQRQTPPGGGPGGMAPGGAGPRILR